MKKITMFCLLLLSLIFLFSCTNQSQINLSKENLSTFLIGNEINTDNTVCPNCNFNCQNDCPKKHLYQYLHNHQKNCENCCNLKKHHHNQKCQNDCNCPNCPFDNNTIINKQS